MMALIEKLRSERDRLHSRATRRLGGGNYLLGVPQRDALNAQVRLLDRLIAEYEAPAQEAVAQDGDHEQVIADLADEAAAATTPAEAFAVAIQTVHYARIMGDGQVPTFYNGARVARALLERVTGQRLGERARPAQEAVAFEAVDLTSVASAVTEAYKPEGQAIWWRNWATADDEKRQRMESGVLGAWSGEPVLPAQEAVEQGEVSMLVKAVGDVLEEHDHADTCGMMLSPGEDYPCSCWQADLWAALIRSTTGPAPAAQEAVAVTDEPISKRERS